MASRNSTQLISTNKEITNLLIKHIFKSFLRKCNNEQKFRLYQFINRELIKIMQLHDFNQLQESIIKRIHFN